MGRWLVKGQEQARACKCETTRATCYFIPQYLLNNQNCHWNYMLLYLNLHYHCHYYDPSFSVRQGHTVLAGQWPPTREEGAGEDGTGPHPARSDDDVEVEDDDVEVEDDGVEVGGGEGETRRLSWFS